MKYTATTAPYIDLANAIVAQAVEDYRYAIHARNRADKIVANKNAPKKTQILARGNRTKANIELDGIEKFLASPDGHLYSHGLAPVISSALRDERFPT